MMKMNNFVNHVYRDPAQKECHFFPTKSIGRTGTRNDYEAEVEFFTFKTPEYTFQFANSAD